MPRIVSFIRLQNVSPYFLSQLLGFVVVDTFVVHFLCFPSPLRVRDNDAHHEVRNAPFEKNFGVSVQLIHRVQS